MGKGKRKRRQEPQVKLAMVRPVVFTDELRELQQRLPASLPLPPIYPDSTIVQCTGCGADCYAGPRISAAMAADPDIRPYCWLCLVKETVEQEDVDVAMITLGNPYGGANAN